MSGINSWNGLCRRRPCQEVSFQLKKRVLSSFPIFYVRFSRTDSCVLSVKLYIYIFPIILISFSFSGCLIADFFFLSSPSICFTFIRDCQGIFFFSLHRDVEDKYDLIQTFWLPWKIRWLGCWHLTEQTLMCVVIVVVIYDSYVLLRRWWWWWHSTYTRLCVCIMRNKRSSSGNVFRIAADKKGKTIIKRNLSPSPHLPTSQLIIQMQISYRFSGKNSLSVTSDNLVLIIKSQRRGFRIHALVESHEAYNREIKWN